MVSPKRRRLGSWEGAIGSGTCAITFPPGPAGAADGVPDGVAVLWVGRRRPGAPIQPPGTDPVNTGTTRALHGHYTGTTGDSHGRPRPAGGAGRAHAGAHYRALRAPDRGERHHRRGGGAGVA